MYAASGSEKYLRSFKKLKRSFPFTNYVMI